MMKAILLFVLLCLTLGGQAQNLKMEKVFGSEKKARWDSLTYRLQYGNGIYCIQDTCDAVLVSDYPFADHNFDYNNDIDSCRIAFDHAQEAWTIQCIKALPGDILRKLVQHVERYPNLNFCMASIQFDREGKVIYVSFQMYGVLFVPLTGFFDFLEGKFVASGDIDFLNPILEGKVTFPGGENTGKEDCGVTGGK